MQLILHFALAIDGFLCNLTILRPCSWTRCLLTRCSWLTKFGKRATLVGEAVARIQKLCKWIEYCRLKQYRCNLHSIQGSVQCSRQRGFAFRAVPVILLLPRARYYYNLFRPTVVWMPGARFNTVLKSITKNVTKTITKVVKKCPSPVALSRQSQLIRLVKCS